MTFDDWLLMLEDYMAYSDEVVDVVPEWYQDWWIENRKGKM